MMRSLNPSYMTTAASSYTYDITDWQIITSSDSTSLQPFEPAPLPRKPTAVDWLRERVDEVRALAFAA